MVEWVELYKYGGFPGQWYPKSKGHVIHGLEIRDNQVYVRGEPGPLVGYVRPTGDKYVPVTGRFATLEEAQAAAEFLYGL